MASIIEVFNSNVTIFTWHCFRFSNVCLRHVKSGVGDLFSFLFFIVACLRTGKDFSVHISRGQMQGDTIVSLSTSLCSWTPGCWPALSLHG